MKFTLLLLAVLLFVALATRSVNSAPGNDKYTTKYDNINIDEILNSSRLVDNYCKCLLDLGRCTPEGTELKKNFIDSLQTGCSKCSPRQKKETPRVIKHLREHKLEECFKPIIAKYDPTDAYKNTFEAELEKDLRK